MRKIVLIVAGGLAGIMLSPAAWAQTDMDGSEPKVVYHVDYPGVRRFSGQLTSTYNMVQHYENQLVDSDVRIVANSFGVRYFTDDPLEDTPFEAGEDLKEEREELRDRIKSMMSTYDVEVAICDITREQLGLSKDDFYEGVTFVDSGVVEVARLQQEGFAYIKAE
ncbi:MAG: DsrE family protein [Thiohalorhabdus sp.]|uniref:DsrE family protein n=1 Tax=Thiohalorhabdus sp. TaxID=3094134 RepID=UPI0039809C50